MTGRRVSVLWCGKHEMVFASPSSRYKGFGGVLATPMVRRHDPAAQPPEHLGALILSLFPKCGRVDVTIADYDKQPVDPESLRLRAEYGLGSGLDYPRPFTVVDVTERPGGWDVTPYERTNGQSYSALDPVPLAAASGEGELGALVLQLLQLDVQPRPPEVKKGKRKKKASSVAAKSPKSRRRGK